MKIRYFYKNVTLSDKTKDYLEEKIEKLGKLVPKIFLYEVEVDKDKKGKFRVEVMIEAPKKLYRAEETSESIEGSVDILVEELKSQIGKDRGKIRDLKKRGARSIKKKTVVAKEARFRK